MDSEQIYNVLLKMLRGYKSYYNVLPCDGLDILSPKIYPFYLVVNNQKAGEPGQHWTALYRQNINSNLEFFCSYGLGVDAYPANFRLFAKKLGCNIIQNIKPLQAIGSNVCGHYCIYFLFKKMKGCCKLALYCKFSDNKKQNDLKIVQFIKSKSMLHEKCVYKGIKQCCTNHYFFVSLYFFLSLYFTHDG